MTIDDREFARLTRVRFPLANADHETASSDEPSLDVKRAIISRVLPDAPFTPTERDIATRLLMNESITSMAQSQECRKSTIKSHLGRIYIKAQVDDSGDLQSQVLKRLLEFAAPHLSHLLE